jgi:hypothetical protein
MANLVSRTPSTVSVSVADPDTDCDRVRSASMPDPEDRYQVQANEKVDNFFPENFNIISKILNHGTPDTD